MPIKLTIVSGSPEPVTVAQVKLAARVDSNFEDTLISDAITSARAYLEHAMGRCILPTNVEFTLDWLPYCLVLPYPPMVSITAVEFKDASETFQAWEPANYVVDAGIPSRIYFRGMIPMAPANTIGSFRITYRSGYATPNDIPADIRNAVQALAVMYYAHREPMVENTTLEMLPHSVQATINMHKITYV